MKLEYEINEQDYIDLNVHHFENSKTIQSAHNKSRFAAPVLFLALPFVMKNTSTIPFWYWMTMFGILAVLWVIFYPSWMKKYYIKQTKKMLREKTNNGILGQKTLSLTEQGIITQGDGDETLTSYGNISQVAEGKTAVYLYNSAVSAIIVPNRAFSSSEQKAEFIREVKNKIPAKTVSVVPHKKGIFDLMDKM